MDEELKKLLLTNFSDLAQWIKSAAEASGDFIAREAPLFVQEYSAWVFWSNLLMTLMFIGFALSMLPAFRYVSRNKEAFSEPDVPYELVMTVLWAITLGFIAIGVTCFGRVAIKAKVAPRVLLVEKAAELAGMEK